MTRFLNGLMGVLALAFIGVICWKQSLFLNAIYFRDFDLAIFTQGVWKLSQFQEPFITIRGLHLFADHFSIVNLLFAPFFWIWSSPLVLLWGQTLVLAASGVFFYLLCREKLKSPYLIASMVMIYSLYPPLLHYSLRQYHENCFSVLFAMMFLWALEKKLVGAAWASVIGLILTKENKPLLAFGLSLYGWLRFRWKPTLLMAATSLASFFLILFVLMPLFRSADEVYPYIDRSLWQVKDFLKGQLPLSAALKDTLFFKENIRYLLALLAPFLFLALLRPLALILNPLFWVVLFSSWPYAHMIEYHYSAGIFATAAYSALCGLSWLETKWKFFENRFFKILILPAVFIFAMGNIQWFGPYELQAKRTLTVSPPPDQPVLDDLKIIQERFKGTPLTVHHSLLSHLAIRDLIFMWPNPFKNRDYGFSPNVTHPVKPEYLIWLRAAPQTPEEAAQITEAGFQLEDSLAALDIYHRRAPAQK